VLRFALLKKVSTFAKPNVTIHKMSTILEKLNKYFQENSEENILRDWSELEEFDSIGPTITSFLQQPRLFYPLDLCKSRWKISYLKESVKNPKFTSDFFLP